MQIGIERLDQRRQQVRQPVDGRFTDAGLAAGELDGADLHHLWRQSLLPEAVDAGSSTRVGEAEEPVFGCACLDTIQDERCIVINTCLD
ncbi:hypothetical protein KDH_59500 [Dictyobacter sp. S3.2.2.5]|uniref:Uncharacterized protein n=1 Tax=Dictyobacter halimunensis TaxID=3026934 RepID=A0ABQ6G1Y9_9CHLR|nr:hypothetical protein KDH_59500 [Dictyobacter sp. S3.2.2.5]